MTTLLLFITKNILEFMVFLFLLRFILQIHKAPYHHPIILLLVNATNFIILPVRRILPIHLRYDYACIVVSIIALWLKYALIMLFIEQKISVAWLVISILLDMMRLTLNIHLYSLMILALSSWFSLQKNTSSPMALIQLITAPCLRLMKPKIWKMFDLRIIILIGICVILTSMCQTYSAA